MRLLVFVGVSHAGVEPIDFCGVDRATQLPLVNVSVPTRLFFLAAPVLTAAIYTDFHLSLIRLPDALGVPRRAVQAEPLGPMCSACAGLPRKT